MLQLDAGVTSTLRHQVRTEDGAARWGNDLPVLATPVLLWLGELAAMQAVTAALEGDEMTVGLRHDSEHIAATPVGWTVEITAVLTRVEGRTLHFTVQAQDLEGTVFVGKHTRAVISRERFTSRLVSKTISMQQPPSASPVVTGGGRA